MPENEDHSKSGSKKPLTRLSAMLRKKTSEEDLFGIWGILLHWTIWTFKLSSIGEFVKRVSGYDMPTDELHGWIALWCLLPQDRTGKHRVIPAFLPQIYFNWQLILMRPNTTALSLFNNLFDVHEHRQRHTAGRKTDGKSKEDSVIKHHSFIQY